MSTKNSKIYIESSVISYLVARQSRDLVVAAHQQLTQEWWDKKRDQFDLFISPLVIKEISLGDPKAAALRKKLAADLPLLSIKEEALNLAHLLLKKGSLPAKAADDALHIALAAVHGMEYLLTWNCTHIANAFMRKKIESLIHQAGYVAPIIATPEELSGE